MNDDASRRIAFVHAHPDDETLGTGGTIARYSSEGAHVCLITCTNGEVGEIAEVPDLGPADEIRPRLGEIRRAELEAACRELGDVDLRMLGYHDSGMDGTPENEARIAFVNQDLTEIVDRVVAILREVRPQVLVTYDENGGYGHPDHIRAHEAAMRAAQICDVPKVYYIAFPKSLMRMASEIGATMGLEFFSDEDIESIGTDDKLITSVIDCTPFVAEKFRALEAHRTQLGTTQMFLNIPDEFRVGLGHEHYVLARSSVARRVGVEDDLFTGTGA
jgi:N-acetyl-1-D-myo-inositol-2-amino-2-deoxy-alpha-D-glucopyranoside deacetylase